MMRKRIPIWLLMVSLFVWAGVAAAQGPPPPAPGAVTSGTEGLKITGFISATAFLQNQNFTFGNGQNAEFPNAPQTTTDRWFLDGDVRNTRLTFTFNGPKLDNGLKTGGVVEGDFFGGFNGTGAFSNAQATPRLRLAYIDLGHGRTTFRIGQNWAPLFGNVAVSYSHIAFPLGYGSAGDVGWRFPGISMYQDLTRTGAAVTSKLTLAVMRNTWNTPGDLINSQSAGQASTLPQVEARLDFGGKGRSGSTWGAYGVVHWDKKDLSGAGVKTANDSLTGWAGEFGAKFNAGPAMLQGNIYTGKAIGQQFGQMAQFGDIKSWGAWVQGGFNFTKRWQGLLFLGTEKANKAEVLAAKQTRTKNMMFVPSLMYSLGPYGFNVEWLHDQVTTGATDIKTKGDQFATSMIFKF